MPQAERSVAVGQLRRSSAGRLQRGCGLTYEWEVILHHINSEDPGQAHTHPDVFTGSRPSASFTGDSHGDGFDLITYDPTAALGMMTSSGATGTTATARFQHICTGGACQAAVGCVHTPIAAGCDDGNHCTGADACAGGACQGGPQLPRL